MLFAVLHDSDICETARRVGRKMSDTVRSVITSGVGRLGRGYAIALTPAQKALQARGKLARRPKLCCVES